MDESGARGKRWWLRSGPRVAGVAFIIGPANGCAEPRRKEAGFSRLVPGSNLLRHVAAQAAVQRGHLRVQRAVLRLQALLRLVQARLHASWSSWLRLSLRRPRCASSCGAVDAQIMPLVSVRRRLPETVQRGVGECRVGEQLQRSRAGWPAPSSLVLLTVRLPSCCISRPMSDSRVGAEAPLPSKPSSAQLVLHADDRAVALQPPAFLVVGSYLVSVLMAPPAPSRPTAKSSIGLQRLGVGATDTVTASMVSALSVSVTPSSTSVACCSPK